MIFIEPNFPNTQFHLKLVRTASDLYLENPSFAHLNLLASSV